MPITSDRVTLRVSDGTEMNAYTVRPAGAGPHPAVGFCMGGRTAFLANSALPLVAAISYYGGGIAPALLDRAPALHGPQLFFWGGQDKGIPPEQRRAVADAVRAAGKRFVDVEFSNANHGFVTAHRYEPNAAGESWALALAFLRDALDGSMSA